MSASESDGRLKCPNVLLGNLTEDVLYHLNLSTKSHDLPAEFGDVKFVIIGGTASRMQKFANEASKVLASLLPDGFVPTNLTGSTDRYVMYKIGPVLSVSHGIGVPSLSIMLHEVFKLLHHAGCSKDVIIIRTGTSGGIGVEPGSVVVSDQALDGELNPTYELAVLGKKVTWPSGVSPTLAEDIAKCWRADDNFAIVKGGTMTANDFYEGQARLDGAVCDYTEDDKMSFLRRAYDAGVRNIEMEANGFAALSNRIGVKAAIVCVTLLNRLNGDQVDTPSATLKEWESRSLRIVLRYISSKLGIPQ